MSIFKQLHYKFRHLTKRQLLLLLYLPIHFIWYLIIEQVNIAGYHIVHSPLDDLIPFCEWFIIPYLLWFIYMAVTGFYFLLKEEKAFERYLLTMWIGFFLSMTFISFFPTGQELRPEILPRDNVASWIVSLIYSIDTNTNVFPSMHVVGALSVATSIAYSQTLKKRIGIQIFSAVLCVLIIAATVFLKQHSILDVFGGIAFYIAAHLIVLVIVKAVRYRDEQKSTGVN